MNEEQTVIIKDEALKKLKGFVQIPNAILLHKNVSFGAKVAYGVLLHYAWQEGFCFPAQKSLANDLRCSDRQVRKLLTELKKHKLIDWKQLGLNRPNIYYILEIPAHQDEESPVWNYNSTPERNYSSTPDRNCSSGQERNYSSDYKETSKHIQNNVNVTNSTNTITPRNSINELDDIGLSKEHVDLIARDIVAQFGDDHSFAFYRLVAQKIPERLIRNSLSSLRGSNAISPARVFTSEMQTYAIEMIKQQTAGFTTVARDNLANKLSMRRE